MVRIICGQHGAVATCLNSGIIFVAISEGSETTDGKDMEEMDDALDVELSEAVDDIDINSKSSFKLPNSFATTQASAFLYYFFPILALSRQKSSSSESLSLSLLNPDSRRKLERS